MSKKLAIKGHPTRGKEVIELLEMLGGINDEGHIGTNTWKDVYYYLDNGHIRAYDWCDAIKFTLEGFWEKYPFKVGDIVDRSIDYVSCVIDNIRWNSEKCCVEYHLNYLNGGECGWHGLDYLIKPEDEDVITETKVESTGFMQVCKTAGIIFNDANYADEVELNLGDYEIEIRDGRTFAIKKKPKYPTTYDECCNMLNADEFVEYDLMTNFPKLINARNAYWKIAGEEMGLGKPWEPDWKNIKQKKYCIYYDMDNIQKGSWYYHNSILAFPTTETRNVFYKNFKDLIESCKELL